MSNVVQFKLINPYRSRVAEVTEERGTILLFTGVRYLREDEVVPADGVWAAEAHPAGAEPGSDLCAAEGERLQA